MKNRVITALLVGAMVLSSAAPVFAGETEAATEAAAATAETKSATEGAASTKSSAAAPDWDEYNSLINQIYSETDMKARKALMHKAEDLLMDTGAVVPLYFYNDIYMLNKDCTGLYANLFGFKYFAYMSAPNNELNANLASEPDHLDPALNSTVDGACLAILNFSGLYAYDKDNKLVPELADGEPQESEDGLTYTFKMKSGLKWSDGDTLDANDVVYSWNRLANPDTAADYSYLIDSMNLAKKDDGTLDIEASDDGSTFTVHLAKPCAYVLDLCAFPAFFPVPQQAIEKADPDGKNPGAWALEAGFVGSGPFTLTSWTHNQSMTYEKNPNYWNADAVSLNKINFMLSADDTAIYNAYKDGSLQFIDTVPNDEIPNVINNDDFYIIPNLGTYYACFNVNSSLFDGKTPEQAAEMRKAFSLLIDRQWIVDSVGQTGQEPAGTFIPDGMADGMGGVFDTNDDDYTYPVTWKFGDKDAVGYYDPSTTGPTDDNIAEARKLLEDAGYEFTDDNKLSDSTPINIEYLTNDGTGHVAVAQSMQQDLAAIGINMTINSEEWNVFLNDRKNGNFDFAREGWLADYNDPINMLEMWQTSSGNNDAQFGR